MRLNRYLASSGVGSRRACDDLITKGMVEVNGEPCTNFSTDVSPQDHVKVRGQAVSPPESIYLLVNKPKGYVTTASDERGRRTVFDLLPSGIGRLHHVGRLDKDSEGLLILTNDGDLTNALSHPSRSVEKEYEVTLNKAFDPKHEKRLLGGMLVEGKKARFVSIRAIKPGVVRIVLHQGLKRQIRLMLLFCGYKVNRLKRIRIGPITDHGMTAGTFRYLTQKEVHQLLKDANSRKPSPSPSAKTSTAASSSQNPR